MTKEVFLRRANNRFLTSFFMFMRLPGAWFMGVRLHQMDDEKVEVHLGYGWRSQNPFRSTYFAAQTAAAELSTGALVFGAIQDKGPISMLLVKNSGEYFKKVDQTLRFVCKQGQEVRELIQKAMETGEGHTIALESEGFLPDGTLASRFEFVWSVRVKR